MPDVFISYSRKNLEFVQELVAALKKSGKDPWFDKLKEPLSGIASGAPWWKQIQDGIEHVDNFLFVISSDSIISPYCHAEISYAREYSKRLVPVLYCGRDGERETRNAINAAIETIPDDKKMPDSVTSSIRNLKELVRENWLAISEIQYDVISSSAPFDQTIGQVIKALDLDLAWLKMYSQLTQAAKLWEASGFDDDFLWQANRLKPVYEMIARRERVLIPLVENFIRPEQERLLHELEILPYNLQSHEQRADIGDRLAEIGDTRFGVGLLPDKLPDLEWLPITSAGEINIDGRLYVVKPFYITKYLITYTQFEAFIRAPDGFGNERWWAGMPKDKQPQNLANQRIKRANNPRNNMSWYPAVAFTRWLDFKYRENGLFRFNLGVPNGLQESNGHQKDRPSIDLNPDEWQIRLPLEWEWQWAAQNGSEARMYPFGEWREGYGNAFEAGLNRSVAVGMYPEGAAACGALDMAGNLWEWCLNDHDSPSNIAIASNNKKTIRGGGYDYQKVFAECARRFENVPSNGSYESCGLRVIVGSIIEGF
jgi:formylglycine-generating enzyme required for sulfatase activity